MLDCHPKPLSHPQLLSLQKWLQEPECRLLKRCASHRMAEIQIAIGAETLLGLRENRTVELGELTMEASRLQNFLSFMDDVASSENPLTLREVSIVDEY